MESTKIVLGFQRYFSAKDIEYCVMLSGTWGSGKTHFVTNSLKPLIEDARKKFIYVSAYGIRNSDDLEKAIFLAAYPLLKSGKVQAFTAIVQSVLNSFKVNIEAILQVQASINENVVICIDDIERCEAEAVPAVLGIINTFITQNKAKVILICDETKLSAVEKYRSWKEKIVGRTFLYSPSIDDQISLLVESPLVKKHRSALKEEEIINLMGGIARRGVCSNLRTLIKAFSYFADVEDLLYERPYFDTLIASKLLKTITALVIEINADASRANDLRDLFLSKQFALNLLFDQTGVGNPETQFVSKYFENDYSALINRPFLYNYVVDGYLDESDMYSYFDSFAKTTELTAIELLQKDFRLLSDEAFTAAVEETLSRIEAGEIRSVETLQTISYFLFFFSEKHLIVQRPHELRRIFLDGLGKPAVLLEDSGDHPPLAFVLNIGNEHREVLNEINNLWQSQESERFNRHKKKVLQSLDTDIDDFCAELYALDRKLASRACLEVNDATKIAEKIRMIIKSSKDANRQITLISRALYARYHDRALYGRFNSEKAFVLQLETSLSDLLESIETKDITAVSSSDEIQAIPSHKVSIAESVIRGLTFDLANAAGKM
jgi:hypothetical protein